MDVWRRIERWLAEHKPEVGLDLRSGATTLAIDAAERAMRVTFPADVRASYARHDGQKGCSEPLLDGWQLLTLKQMASEWKIQHKLWKSGVFSRAAASADAGIRAEWWNPGWIPTFSNGAGDLYCVDTAPAEGGLAGQLIAVWHAADHRDLVATGLADLLATCAKDLEAGAPGTRIRVR